MQKRRSRTRSVRCRRGVNRLGGAWADEAGGRMAVVQRPQSAGSPALSPPPRPGGPCARRMIPLESPVVNGGGIMVHAERPVGSVAAAQIAPLMSPCRLWRGAGDVWRGALCSGTACGCQGGPEPSRGRSAVRDRPRRPRLSHILYKRFWWVLNLVEEDSAMTTLRPELLDELLSDYETPEDLLGDEGLFKQLKKALLERALGAELTDHLGYEKGDPAGRGSGNSRNGHSGKTVLTEDGAVELAVPRDRNGSFESAIVPKGERRLDGFDDRILSLYARGMTVREIQGPRPPSSGSPRPRRSGAPACPPARSTRRPRRRHPPRSRPAPPRAAAAPPEPTSPASRAPRGAALPTATARRSARGGPRIASGPCRRTPPRGRCAPTPRPSPSPHAGAARRHRSSQPAILKDRLR